eukprot:SAG31_NODE_240_length_19407_cov_29.686140_2_plen_155_part_00
MYLDSSWAWGTALRGRYSVWYRKTDSSSYPHHSLGPVTLRRTAVDKSVTAKFVIVHLHLVGRTKGLVSVHAMAVGPVHHRPRATLAATCAIRLCAARFSGIGTMLTTKVVPAVQALPGPPPRRSCGCMLRQRQRGSLEIGASGTERRSCTFVDR